MHRLKEKLIPILEGMPVSVVVWEGNPDMTGPDDLRLVFANQAAEDTASQSLHDRVGSSMEEAFPGVLGTLTARNIFKLLTEDTNPGMFEDLVNGRWFRVGLFKSDGRRVISTYYNIDSERELAKSNHLLQITNSHLEQFAYVASHDLQEPLRTITSYVEILRTDLEGKLTPEDDENLDYIYKAANRLRGLVTGLLDFSRITTRSTEYKTESLTEVAKAAAKDLGDDQRWITVEDLGSVQMDRAQLHRAFVNLFSNSVKYAQPGLDPQILVHSLDNEHEVIVSVQDNGRGIDPTYHDMVFQPFKRLHTQQDIPGTGIGLSIVKRIVERHGGTLWIESDGEGKGTTIRFILPKGSPEPPEG